MKKGQVLAKLEAGVESAMVNSASARVEFAKRKLVVNQQLFIKQLVSNHEKDQLET